MIVFRSDLHLFKGILLIFIHWIASLCLILIYILSISWSYGHLIHFWSFNLMCFSDYKSISHFIILSHSCLAFFLDIRIHKLKSLSMLNSGVGALLIQLWSWKCMGWRVKKRSKKKGWKGVEEKVGSLKVNVHWSSWECACICWNLLPLSILLHGSSFIHHSYGHNIRKLHESLIQVRISHKCQFSNCA